jgi:hypothetical protein
VLDLELLPKNPFWRAIISTANANNLVTLDMDTLSILRDSSTTLHRTSWTWIPSQIWETVPQQGEDDQRVQTEKTQFNINGKEEDCIFSPRVEQYSQSKRSYRCLTQATLTYSWRNPWWKRRNNEYQGALWWPLKLNLQQDLSLGENPLGKCPLPYIPIMLPVAIAKKTKNLCFPFL